MLKAELIERAARFRSAGDDPSRHVSDCPALVLNADYTPLSYYPLSVWSWQTAIKAVFLERVDIVASYEREVHSPSWAMKLPSVIALREFVRPSDFPAFTRFNLFLRSCGSAPAGGAHRMGKHRRCLRTLQSEKRRAHPPAGRNAPDRGTDPPHHLAVAGSRPRLSAQLSS